jgi:dCTP deaminase
MLLSTNAILRHLEQGNIVIDPFHSRKLKSASYDVSLGPWYWEEQHPGLRSSLYNPFDKAHVDKVWGTQPKRAEPAHEIMSRYEMKLENIKPDDLIILLKPGATVLGHTIEFIGGRNVCIGKLYARSSLGRNFVEVCKDAGWGDVGYFNRWTMEITNNSQYFSIPLVVGRRIAQMVFYEVEPIVSEMSYEKGGHYQASGDLEEMKKSWHPQMMLPKMYNDWEVRELHGELKNG